MAFDPENLIYISTTTFHPGDLALYKSLSVMILDEVRARQVFTTTFPDNPNSYLNQDQVWIVCLEHKARSSLIYIKFSSLKVFNEENFKKVKKKQNRAYAAYDYASYLTRYSNDERLGYYEVGACFSHD